MENAYAIECRGITKRFGEVLANDNINLNVKYGEILALLGENGSGKTTLMNMLSGIYHPDMGEIFINSKQVNINSPVDSINLGIGMIHQHFKLVNVFSAMNNVVLGTKEKRLSKKALKEKILAITEKYDLSVVPEKKVFEMSVGEKQTVEILKVLYRNAKILILDEPTAVLTPQETEKLFAILRKMRDSGCAIIIITHKLNEVMNISDRVTILRKGKSIDTVETKAVNEKMLTELMVGRPVSLQINRPEPKEVKKAIEIENLVVENANGSLALKNVSFHANSGEILGIAGVAGSGQRELCESITGLIKSKSGKIIFKDENIVGLSPAEIIKLGISMGFVPEDRLGMGLVASMGMTDNMMLKTYNDTKSPFISRALPKKRAKQLKEKLEIVTPSIEMPVRLMSGGNVQKVLIGREIESNPSVLITAYPVRGLDINSSYVIYDLLNEQKQKGCAVIYIGEDIDVLLELSDRIMVMCNGEIIGIVDAKNATKDQIGLMMSGVAAKEGEQNEK